MTVHDANEYPLLTLLQGKQLTNYPALYRVLSERYAKQLVLSQAASENAVKDMMRSCDIETLLLMPMVFHDRTIGAVAVLCRKPDRIFTEEEISVAQLLTNQAAGAVANAQVYTQTRQELKSQIVLREAIQIFSSTLDRQTVLNSIAQQLYRTLEATSAYICLYNPEDVESIVVAEYVGAEANEKERQSDLGASYDLDPEDAAAFRKGLPEVWHLMILICPPTK